jgi:hypothetical protein
MTDADQVDGPDADESLADRVHSHVKGNRTGMIQDLAFAVAWVTIVSLLYDFLFSASPRWVLYMFMLAGIPAYFGFFISLELAKQQR